MIMKKPTCYQVAEYLLWLVNGESGDCLTHLKLQKLMYFSQGMNLLFYDEPLFEEEIVAHKKGPVVEELYKKYGKLCVHCEALYKKHGQLCDNCLAYPLFPTEVVFMKRIQDMHLLNKIYNIYGEHSASHLDVIIFSRTHHYIFRQAYDNPDSKIITKEEIKACFKTELDTATDQDLLAVYQELIDYSTSQAEI
jgi:uncharacterized phage-associated protein